MRAYMVLVQIMVLPGAQACGVPPAELAYDLALAYIAEGYTTGKPHYITRAAQLLKGAEQGHALQRAASAVGAGRKGEEEEEEEGAAQGTAIERAVCAVLLNDRAAALELLNLAPSSRDEPEPQMEQFVRVRLDWVCDPHRGRGGHACGYAMIRGLLLC